MTRTEAKDYIKARISCEPYLEKSRSGGYCCPACGSGHGKNQTGAVKYYPETNTYYCHACGQGGDVISLYRQINNIDFSTALDELAREAGVDIDRGDKSTGDENKTPKRVKGPAPSAGEEPKRDYTEYYKNCQSSLAEPAAVEYLRSRGINYFTAEAAGVGYDSSAKRIIIPNSKWQYTARAIDPEETPKYKNSKGAAELFNLQILYAQDVQEVFITEGAFDALTFMELGYPAIALNSASNTKLLQKALEEKRTEATLLLCLDNDEKGRAGTDELKKAFDRLNISYISPDPDDYLPDGCKDANEALTASRSIFADAVAAMLRKTARPDAVAGYIERAMLGDMESFREEKKTGFPLLDYRAGGGLYPGLYVLAAISSLGKTTWAAQLADQLAAGGEDVIFFSLEQSRLEMVSKSIARQNKKMNPDSNITSLQIRKGKHLEEIWPAVEAYTKAVEDRISIIEGNFACDSAYIRNYIRQYMKRTGTRPVVIIDYLQILQPGENDRRQSMREVIDTTVTELKRLSRELDLTILVISSVNRANYLTPIDFESLKESGGIEYTADVVLGLQLQCLNEDIFNKESKTKEKRDRVREAKAATPRKVELVCLKNRYGVSSFSCYFDYYPASDLFIETADESDGGSLDVPKITKWY